MVENTLFFYSFFFTLISYAFCSGFMIDPYNLDGVNSPFTSVVIENLLACRMSLQAS